MNARNVLVAVALCGIVYWPTTSNADYLRMTFANGGAPLASKGAVLTILPLQKLDYSVPFQANSQPERVLVGVAVDRVTVFGDAAKANLEWNEIAIDASATASSAKTMSLLLRGARINSIRIAAEPGQTSAAGPAVIAEIEFVCKHVSLNQAGKGPSLGLPSSPGSPFQGTYAGTFTEAPGGHSPLGGISAKFTVGANGEITGTLISENIPRFGGAAVTGKIDAKGNVDATAQKAPFGQVHFTGPLTLSGGYLKGTLTATFNLNKSSVVVNFQKN